MNNETPGHSFSYLHRSQVPVSSTAPTILLALFIFCGAIAPLHAQEKKEEKGPAVAKIIITPASGTAQIGDNVQFKATAMDSSGKTLDVKVTTWFASPFDAAGADQDGTVHFSSPGDITIGAVIGDTLGFARFTVGKAKAAKVQIEPIEPLAVGSNFQLSGMAYSADGFTRPDVELKWRSASPNVAKVDASGMVTAVAPGTARIEALGDSATATISVHVVADSLRRLTLEPQNATAKTGDVLHFKVLTHESNVPKLATTWAVSGDGASIYPDGGFVAELPGSYIVSAMIGSHRADASIEVKPRNAERELEVVAHVQPKGDDGAPMQMAEEWIIGKHAYLSTIADRIYLYDIADPANPKLLDTMKVDARLVNDISTTPDEKIGVITREEASNRKNGIVFLDLSRGDKLQTYSEYTETVTGGVHSAFIDKHYVYITDDATGSLRVIDFQDPKHPKEVARWQVENNRTQTIVGPEGPVTTGRYLHDLYVKDGLAYLCYWRDGMIILDVGNGIKGGTPEHPQVVSQYLFNHFALYGNEWIAGTHSAFRYKNYLFVGDEVLPAFFNITSKDRVPTRGICHVLDISDIEHPREVAYYEIPEGASHNFWADDDKLFEGNYSAGGRVLDISGELRGDLYRQGREIGKLWTGDPQGFRVNMPLSWGAQPHDGLFYVNDINSGLWIVKIGKPLYTGSTETPPLNTPAGSVPK